jgi:negative regulator of replication initiation
MSPTIRIDDDVYKGLQKLARPFEDTPNSIIRRLLEQNGAIPPVHETKRTPNVGTRRKRKGTPQAMLEEWLLFILESKFKGIADRTEAIEATMSVLKNYKLLVEEDFETVTTGEIRVENRIAWARNALKEKGLLKAKSKTGYWELTEGGRLEARKLDLNSLKEKHLKIKV